MNNITDEELRFDAQEILNDAIWEEFTQSYTDIEVWKLYEENNDPDMDIKDFTQYLFEEYKEHRLE